MRTVFILFLFTFSAFGRTTLEQVKHNKPSIEHKFAVKISNLFDEMADKYKVPANVIAAIAMVESSYRLNAVNKRSKDFGIMQVNLYNIKAYNFDKQRLLNDVRYSIEAGVIVFQWFYKIYNTAEEAVKRYNAGTAKGATKWKGPINYWKKVQKYM